MVKKVGDYLNRAEVYDCLEDSYKNCKHARVFRAKQDYSGNYNEIYSAYVTLNLKLAESLFVDFFLDNLLVGEQKTVEHIYCVKTPPSNFLKFESLKVLCYTKLGQKCYASSNVFEQDFVVFDDNVAIILDWTEKGALVGGHYITEPEKVKKMQNVFDRFKKDAKDFLSVVPCEETLKKGITKKLDEIIKGLKDGGLM